MIYRHGCMKRRQRLRISARDSNPALPVQSGVATGPSNWTPTSVCLDSSIPALGKFNLHLSDDMRHHVLTGCTYLSGVLRSTGSPNLRIRGGFFLCQTAGRFNRLPLAVIGAGNRLARICNSSSCILRTVLTRRTHSAFRRLNWQDRHVRLILTPISCTTSRR